MSIRALYILLVVGTALVLLAAIAIYLRVRRHLRVSSEQRREISMTEKNP